MAVKLRSDALKVLAEWKAGTTLRVPELGHVHRMKEHPGMSARIDDSQRLHHDQDRAYNYCFAILDYWREIFELQKRDTFPTWEEFSAACDAYVEPRFRESAEGLTTEELDGAESVAWKALLVGWTKAIDGHAAKDYVEVTLPQEKKQESAT